MRAIPEKLQKNQLVQSPDCTWIVRVKRRRDGKKYYFRHDCCLTARKESSMLMPESVSRGLAHAIASQHPDFTAWAVPYDAKAKKHRQAAVLAARRADELLMSESKVECRVVPVKENKDARATS